MRVLKVSEKSDILEHCHIANPYDNRFYPSPIDSTEAINLYRQFFESLQIAGYDKKISIESGIGERIINIEIPGWVEETDRLFYSESKKSLEFMKSLQ